MGSEISVLVVDEERDMLDLTQTFLERESDRIAVTTEEVPATAVERAVEFDCVVTDLRMPGMDGVELCAAIHDHHPDRPVFLFTAAEAEDIDADGVDLAGVVQKGTGTEHYIELVEQIEAAVE